MKTKRLFTRLLNLSGKTRVCVGQICWKENHFKIELVNKYTQQPVSIIVLKSFKQGEQRLYEKYRFMLLENNLVILSSKTIVQGYLDGILKGFSENLSELEPNFIFSTVFNDSHKVYRDFTQENRFDNKEILQCKSLYDWGDEGFNNSFFINYSFVIDPGAWISLSEPGQISLRCSDIECNNMDNPFNFYFFDREYTFPRSRDNKSIASRMFEGKDLVPEICSRCSIVDLKEEDIILGGDEKIYNALDRITRQKGVPVEIICTCMNRVIGSDIASIVEKINRKNKAKIVYTECDSKRYHVKRFAELIENLIKSKKNRSSINKSINLMGFEDDRGMRELIGILNDFFGVKLNLMLSPEINLTSLEYFHKARLHVINSFEIYRTLFNDILKKINVDSLVIAPPYGIMQTIKWLESIGGYFGVSTDKSRKWNEYYNEKMAEWEILTKKAGEFSLGFVLSRQDVELIANPAKYPFGVPLLCCLEEMGFRINILIISQEDFDNQKKSIMDILVYKDKHKIELLNNPEDIEGWISETDCNCVYSDFRHDTRIIASGKTSFSVCIFEKGFDGAIRSLKKILKFCEIDFFSKYQRYIQSKPRIIIEERDIE